MYLIVNCGSTKVPAIENCFQLLNKEYNTISLSGFDNSVVHDYFGIVLSGSPVLLSESDTNTYKNKVAFIKQINTPLLGICFGHQLLGIAYESQVYKAIPVRSEIPVKIIKEGKLFKNFCPVEFFTEDHTEGISLPDEFELLASSDYYRVEAMQHKYKKQFGVQFHPEVSGENGILLFHNFCEICNN